MKAPFLKSFEKQMQDQGYHEVTSSRTDCHSNLICFGEIPEGCKDYVRYKVEKSDLAEPLREASLDSPSMWSVVESIFIKFEKPKTYNLSDKTKRQEMPYRLWVKCRR